MNKIVIIGCGNVGMSYAYALLNQKANVQELVLIDLNEKKVEGEVMDLNHCLAFAPTHMNIKKGNYSDCSDATIVMIAAGANQNPGETRMDLINKNSKIFKSIVTEVMKNGFDGIFLVATNPLDVMTYITWKYSGLPSNKVIGSGTSLDTSRLRYLISERLKVSPKNVHAYVIGEHGDSEFVPWSNANVGLQNIVDFIDVNELENICTEVKNAAYEIIDKKGATCYGIGMCLVRITNAILQDENTIITVSSFDPNNKVFVGGPTIINRNGSNSRIYVKLNEDETNKLQRSISVIKKAINSIDE
ncbi:MAG: L-lactate dehydrogenase [Clostridium sp.]|nr:L-lactate dehydrogenase [Clostridium sp.]MCM1443836.1 L-lactate dehydrogenase [Candidatus Amulumruptor caecigallinarius]